MRMSLLQKLDAQTHYGIATNTVFSESRMSLVGVNRLTYCIGSQDVSNSRNIEMYAEDVVTKLFAHDYRLINNIFPSLLGLSASADPNAASQFVVDLRCTLEELRKQYSNRYVPLVIDAVKSNSVEFDPRKYLKSSLVEDVDLLIREGISGNDLKHMYPSLETYKDKTLVNCCFDEFVKRCDEYQSDKDPKTLRKAVAILVAVNASI